MAISSQFSLRFVLGLLLLVAGGVLVWVFKGVAASFAAAAAIYLILDAPTRLLQQQGVPRWQAVSLVVLIVIVLSMTVALFVGTSVLGDAQQITSSIPNLGDRLQGAVEMIDHTLGFDVSDYLTDERLTSVQEYFVGIVSGMVSFLSRWVVNVVLIVPLLSILLLSTGSQLKHTGLSLVPNSYFEMSVTILDQVVETLREYIFAKFLESLVVALISVVGFALIGVPAPLLLGVLAGLLNLIPYFGPLLSAVPPVLMAIIAESPSLALASIGVIVVAQIIDNAVLQPLLVSRIVNVHPVIVVLITFIGADLFGAIGMVIAIPVYTISKILVVNLYQFVASIQRRTLLEERERQMESLSSMS